LKYPNSREKSTRSGIAITLDRYGHLFEGTHRDAARRLDDYLVATQ
jgi:hypothetical protein